MKKFISFALILAFALLLASPVLASVGVRRGVSHTLRGEATDIDVGDAGYFDGSTLYLGYNYIVGTGTSTMVSGPNAIPVTYKEVTQTMASSNAQNTLANGTAGQILILTVASNGGTYTWKVTPATTVGYTYLTLSHVGSYAVLMYINDTYGWQVVKYGGDTTTT